VAGQGIDAECGPVGNPWDKASAARCPVERARLLDRVVATLGADKARDKTWDSLMANRRRDRQRRLLERTLIELKQGHGFKRGDLQAL